MSRSLRMSHADPFADSPTVEVLEPHLAVGSHQEDAVTRRRILAALPEDIAAPGSGGRPVVVLAVDLAATEATKAIRAAREATSDAAVVVVTPPGGDSEARRPRGAWGPPRGAPRGGPAPPGPARGEWSSRAGSSRCSRPPSTRSPRVSW